MKINTKNSPITIRMKPLGTNLVQIVVFNSITGEEFLHVFNYTKKYKEVEEPETAVSTDVEVNQDDVTIDESADIITAEVEEGVNDEND